MAPPSETPASSRFLPAIKRPNLHQFKTPGQTPNQERIVTGPNVFRATPRFSTSTPRPATTQAAAAPAFTTPSLALKSLKTPRLRTNQDIIDDDSPSSPHHSPDTSPTDQRIHLPEPIDGFPSSFISQSPIKHHDTPGRSPKRRRISITSSSPIRSQFPDEEQQQEALSIASSPIPSTFYNEDPLIPSTLHDISSDSSTPSSPSHSPSPPPQEPSSSPSPSDNNANLNPNPNQPPKKPTFHPPPRFRPPTTTPNAPTIPEVFSPQRRGDRYIPGGLASELRDWLIQVKESEPNDAGSIRLGIQEVRSGGPGMRLILARLLGANGEVGPQARAILAGEGGHGGEDGLNKTDEVTEGGVVTVTHPAWDVDLDERWAVAYRWEVTKDRVGGG